MKTEIVGADGARFLDEAARFALRHRCDDCVHFDDAGAVCGHGYPTAEHRDGRRLVVFCKEFELA